jgi:hypothetical protein
MWPEGVMYMFMSLCEEEEDELPPMSMSEDMPEECRRNAMVCWSSWD